MVDVSIEITLGKLIAWLETWRNPNGAYNGFVIHRMEMKRMGRVHDTAWTQSAMIRGYANLYRKSNEPRWSNALALAADLQNSRLDSNTGKYRYAGHENDRFCSLVHCALANCALLDAGSLLDLDRREEYLQTVRINVDKYWFPRLWVQKEGAFRFSEVDHYSPHENRFVINFNTMAAECLLLLSEATGQKTYKDIALRIGKWLIQCCNKARHYYFDLLEGKNGESWMSTGGLPYQYTPSQREPNNCVCLYAGLSLRGIAALYKATQEMEYARIARETMQFLFSMCDPKSKLMYHTTKHGRIDPYPQFIAGLGMALTGIDEVQKIVEIPKVYNDIVQSILSKQYKNGSFPSFIGKNRSSYRKGKGIVWEDIVASVNWNAQLFEYLSRRVESPVKIKIQSPSKTVHILSKYFYYTDSTHTAYIFSWWPPRSWGIYLYMKKRSRALVSIYPVLFHSIVRRLLSRIATFIKINKTTCDTL